MCSSILALIHRPPSGGFWYTESMTSTEQEFIDSLSEEQKKLLVDKEQEELPDDPAEVTEITLKRLADIGLKQK